MRVLVVALVAAAAGCQQDVHTAFPPGLEPLEDNPIAAPASGPYSEGLQTQTDDTGYIHAYGLGFIAADAATVWRAAKDPAALVAACNTDEQAITLDDEPQYELSFVVHYTVHNIVTVEWDDAWRLGTIEGTPDAPELAMIRHQKVDGSSFITRSEGTIQLAPAPDDAGVTEVAFVEHLDSVGGSDDAVVNGMKHTFAALLALAHGGAIPPCP